MARPKYPSDEVDKTMVRFPPGLMSRVKQAAAENHRSMNAEIIARLEESFEQDSLLPRLGAALSGLESDFANEKAEFEKFSALIRQQMAAFSIVADIISETNGSVPPDVVDAMKQIVAARRPKTPKP